MSRGRGGVLGVDEDRQIAVFSLGCSAPDFGALSGTGGWTGFFDSCDCGGSLESPDEGTAGCVGQHLTGTR